MFAPDGSSRTYSIARVEMPARQGEMSVPATGNVDLERSLQRTGEDTAQLYPGSMARFNFRPTIPVGWLHPHGDTAGADSHSKLEVALTLNRAVPRDAPVAPGAPTWSSVTAPGVDENVAALRGEAFLRAMDRILAPVGFPANPLALEGGVLNDQSITLIHKGVYGTNNTSGFDVGVGDRFYFGHPLPGNFPRLKDSKRPKVIASEDAPGTVNYQMILMSDSIGAGAFVQRLLAGGDDPDFTEEVGDLSSRGQAAIIAQAFLRAAAMGIINFAADCQGGVADAGATFGAGSAAAARYGNAGNGAFATGNNLGAFVESLVGEEGHLRRVLIPAVMRDDATQVGDFANAGDHAAVAPALSTGFVDACAGYARATEKPALCCTVVKGGAPGDGIMFEMH